MSFLKHVTVMGDWRCDVRDSGSNMGQRVATKLGAGGEVEVQLEWHHLDGGEPLPDGEQFLMTDIKSGWSRVCAVPQRVLEWLKTGEVGAQEERPQGGDHLDLLANQSLW